MTAKLLQSKTDAQASRFGWRGRCAGRSSSSTRSNKALSVSSGRETVKVLACRDALHDKQKCRILVLEVGVETGSLVAEKIQDIETDKVSSRPRLDRASTARVETTRTTNTCGIFPDLLKHLQVAPRIERRRSWACHASLKPSSRPQPRRRELVTSSRRAQSLGFGTKKSSSTRLFGSPGRRSDVASWWAVVLWHTLSGLTASNPCGSGGPGQGACIALVDGPIPFSSAFPVAGDSRPGDHTPTPLVSKITPSNIVKKRSSQQQSDEQQPPLLFVPPRAPKRITCRSLLETSRHRETERGTHIHPFSIPLLRVRYLSRR